jgi:hypothetical protein
VAVLPSRLPRADAGRPHPALTSEPVDEVEVDPAPVAGRLARRPPLSPGVLVDALGARVDPPEAQGLRDGLLPRQASVGDVLLVETHPELGLGLVVLLEPCPEVVGAVEEQRRLLGRSARP